MTTIKVLFEDGDSLVTDINGTEPEIDAYYIGNMFNLGDGQGGDRMAKAVYVIHNFIDKIDVAKTDYANRIAPLAENDEQFEKLAEEIATHYLDDNRFEYCDNLRLARQDRPETVLEYEHRKASGCCGHHDTEFVCNGVTFMVGFNYGH
jgi:hypothetical protein